MISNVEKLEKQAKEDANYYNEALVKVDFNQLIEQPVISKKTRKSGRRGKITTD